MMVLFGYRLLLSFKRNRNDSFEGKDTPLPGLRLSHPLSLSHLAMLRGEIKMH